MLTRERERGLFYLFLLMSMSDVSGIFFNVVVCVTVNSIVQILDDFRDISLCNMYPQRRFLISATYMQYMMSVSSLEIERARSIQSLRFISFSSFVRLTRTHRLRNRLKKGRKKNPSKMHILFYSNKKNKKESFITSFIFITLSRHQRLSKNIQSKATATFHQNDQKYVMNNGKQKRSSSLKE